VHTSTSARLALLALVWGSSFFWIKLSLRGLSPVEVTFGRLVLGAAVLFVIAAAARSPLPSSPALWAHLTVAALFGNAAPYLLFALGEQKVSSSAAGILNATTPLWTLVVAMATRHERTVTPARLAGLVTGFGGALLIFSPWHSGSELTSAGGLECLGAAVSYGIAFVYMDRFIAGRGISPVAASAGQLLIASGFLGAGLAVAGAPGPRPGVVVGVSIAILGLFGTGIAYILNYSIIMSDGATVASTVTYLLPVVAILLGIAVLGEHISLPVLAGIALILCGVALVRKRPAKAGGDCPARAG
jgi:drug/metabolite transporter (DMT)-like permease